VRINVSRRNNIPEDSNLDTSRVLKLCIVIVDQNVRCLFTVK
jgi:hypothetical protein